MKKKLTSFLLALVMCMLLSVPAFAVNSVSDSAYSVAASKISILQQRADLAQAKAIEEHPMATILTDNDVDQLTTLLASVLGEIDKINAGEINSDDEKNLFELEEKKNSIQTQLEIQGVLVLTDDDLEMIFGETQINVRIDDVNAAEPGISPTSSSDAVMWPITTQYALWTYSGLKTNYSKPCYYVQATPKTGATRSTLYNIRDQLSVERPYGDLTKASVEFGISMVSGAVGSILGSAALGSAFGVAVSSSTTPTKYEYEFEEVLSVRFAYVYLAAEDRYSCTLISHSDSIVYSHRAFGKGWKSASPVDASGDYYDLPFDRAISNFNSGSGNPEIDHYKTYTAQIKYNDGSKERLAQFVPIYVSSMTMVN